MDISLLVAQFFSGMTTAAVLFLMAAGLALIFGVLHVLNMAHCSFYLIAAFIASSITMLTSNFWLALIVAPVAVAIVGGLTEIGLFRRAYTLSRYYQLLLSFGLIYVFADLMKIIWGGKNYFSRRPEILGGGMPIGEQIIPHYSLFTIGIAIVVGVLLWALLHKTRLGNLIRAIDQDREASVTLGIDTVKLSTLTFVIGTFMAGVGGAVASAFLTIRLGLDVEVLTYAIMVVLIGGMASIGGSAIAAIIVGLAGALGVMVMPQIATALPFIILAIILIVRPWGLSGEQLE